MSKLQGSLIPRSLQVRCRLLPRARTAVVVRQGLQWRFPPCLPLQRLPYAKMAGTAPGCPQVGFYDLADYVVREAIVQLVHLFEQPGPAGGMQRREYLPLWMVHYL